MTESDERQTHASSVSRATRKALERVDALLHGATLKPPAAQYKRACDELVQRRSASDLTAVLFFVFYWLEEPAWDVNSIPRGWRDRAYGDRFLCEGLTRRHITLHGRTRRYGDHVESGVDQPTYRLMMDEHYGPFLRAVISADIGQRQKIAEYLAQRFAESGRVPSALPPVHADVLTSVRAEDLIYRLMDTPSGGTIPHFLIAALLFVYRRRRGARIVPHQVHAAASSDQVAGDIEEYADGNLRRAYAITVGPEWRTSVSVCRDRMDKFHLWRYFIFAIGVNEDAESSVPAKLALNLEPYERAIAVVDLLDVMNFLIAELTPDEFREAVNRCYEYLNDLNLCGDSAYIGTYRRVVHDWLG